MALTTLFLTGVELSARMYRGLVTDLFGEGIRNVGANEFRVIPRALGANMTVTIQKGTGEDAVAYIKGDDVTGQGTYRITHDADFLDLTVAAAPASGSRTDLVVLEVVDSQVVGGSTNLSRFRVLTGVSALTTEKTVIPLARITVASGATSIQAANITDLRTAATGGGAAVRTAAEVLTQAQIDALTSAQRFQGRLFENATTGRLQHVATAGGAPADVMLMAQGSTSLTLNVATSATVVFQFFVGTGFSEVQWFGTEASSGTGVGGLALSDPLLSVLEGTGSSGGTSKVAPTTTSSGATAFVNCTVSNMSYSPSTGYVTFSITAPSNQALARTIKLNWRAR